MKIKLNKNNPLIQCGFVALFLNAAGASAAEISGDVNLGDINVSDRRENDDSDIIGRQQLARFRGLGNGDALSGIGGVQVNSVRNEAGALDVGIRGVQGEGRVPIIIDGSLQSTHTFRGYQGESDRTYIDMDLISQVQVDKGATNGKYSTGAIGGVVQMKTLGVDDILLPGENAGVLFKGVTYNNNRKPHISGDEMDQEHYILSDSSKPSHFNNGAATAALAWQNDFLDVVAAYSRREAGNYFAGKRGIGRYREDATVSKGQEVVNTSYESHSGIAKLGLNVTDGQRLELNYRRHVQKAGEVMAAYWYKQSQEGDDSGAAWYSPAGKSSMPQWSLGSAAVDAWSMTYSLNPEASDLIDLTAGAWKTMAKLDQHNGAWGEGSAGDQYKLRYSDQRQGVNVSNRSRLRAIPLSVDYGATYDEQRMKPRTAGSPDAVARDGRRSERSAYVNGTLDTALATLSLGSKLHRASTTDYRQDVRASEKAKADLLSQLRLHVTDSVDLYAKAASSWRSPSLFESTSSAQTFNYNPRNPVKPENARSWEAGVSGEFRNLLTGEETLRVKAGYFHNHIRDFISAARLPRDPLMPAWKSNYSFLNYDSVTLKGIELALSYDNPYVFIDGSATFYRRPEICSRAAASQSPGGEPGPACTAVGYEWSLISTRIPPRRAFNLTVGTRLLNGDMTVGSRLRYHSRKNNPEGWMQGTGARAVVAVPSEKIIDLFASYRVSPQLSLSLNVDNLTNRYAFDPGTVIGMPMPGRTVRAGLEVRF